ncbi:metallophosphoesterase [Acidithiobacillus caldus]
MNPPGFLGRNPKVVHQGANSLGRDFIVGDLHGCRALLDALLQHVQFAPERDRLFSVGDLVDRWPDSEACLELLREPWFYPVLGNHDAMLMAWISGGRVDQRCRLYEYAFVHNRGWQWVRRFLRASEFLPLLEGLPLVRVVGQGESRFHVAHAELQGSSDWTDALLDQSPDGEWERRRFVTGFGEVGDGVDAVLWGRALRLSLAQGEALPDQRGLSRTYVGHTITVLPDPAQLLSIGAHVYLDTGAYKLDRGDDDRFGLTLWSHQENRGWKNEVGRIREVRI